MKRSVTILASAIVALTLAGCGSAAKNAGAPITASPLPSGSPSAVVGPVVNVTVTATKIISSANAISVQKGQNLTLRLTAVAPGELHVHSTPEQHIEYPKGTSTVTLSFDTPGVVEIEDHALNQVVVAVTVN